MTDLPRHPPAPGDGWVRCGCGARHWGLHGAAGLLVARRAPDGRPTHVLLQHRAPWSHHGGTWGIPGGARQPHEDATAAALREAHEEAGVPADAVRPFASHVLRHPDWSYTTVLADEVRPFEARATDAESLAVAWVPIEQVAALDLLPAFADAWPTLLAAIPATPESAPCGPDA
ncbi:NUDIX hydrolase [Cellulomonas sp. PSBB021]|uniref:NUDIX hydrolase n=1 Tax=Cellulomonas sp. PSBB021 TaxID=2003551 RepID=UPI000B8D5E92|nr:NUDIX hydrolase [Cellulomonas sp. PSBB021]ASR53897.1 NUDIX hydrolase [Cellulomonas sp. PSBB021]